MNNVDRAGASLRTALVLVIFAALTGGGVAWIKQLTAARIAANEQQARAQRVAQILPRDSYDNLPGEDRVVVDDSLLGATPQALFRARRGDEPAASIIQVTAGNGYNGSIELLVGVNLHGEVLGVRTVRHRETPGLGDGIEVTKDDWILQFEGLSLAAPEAAWAVRRDGGQFDQLTGATVTSRAVIGAVHNALLYFELNRGRIFAAPGEP